MKKLSMALLAMLFANVISVSAARAAIYETPFLASDGLGYLMVSGSEGKVNEDGSYKVEILTGEPNFTFAVCSITALDPIPQYLTDATSDSDGELKQFGTLPAGVYPGFAFLISDTAGVCSGVVRFVSGFGF